MIHADIDPAEIGKIREPEVPIVGDAKSVITGLIEKLDNADLNTSDWLDELNQMKKEYPLSYNQEEKGPLKVPFVLEELQKLAQEETKLSTELFEKYGKGNVDLDEGTITPVE